MSEIEVMDYNQYKKVVADEIYYGFEGLKIDVYSLNGKVFRTWKSHLDILEEPYLRYQYYLCGGLKDEELYNGDNLDEKYEFLMVVPDLFLYSKNSFEHGFMILLNGRLEKLLRKWEDVGQRAGVYENGAIGRVEADAYLKRGFYPEEVIGTMDEELWPGEFICVRVDQKNYRVESAGYQYRKSICGAADNYVQRFHQLTDLAFINYKDTKARQLEAWTQYSTRFRNLTHVTENEVHRALKTGDLICWNEVLNSNNGLEKQRDRIYNLWLNLLGAVPLRHQNYIYKLLRGYYDDRHQLVQWLTQLRMNKINFKMSHKLSTLLSKIQLIEIKQLTKHIADILTCESGLNIYQFQLEYRQYLANSIQPPLHCPSKQKSSQGR